MRAFAMLRASLASKAWNRLTTSRLHIGPSTPFCHQHLSRNHPNTRSMRGEGSREGRKPNRLANEESPYLLQHAYNPVDWLPWGDEAFELARQRDQPIFLSIGYSTCHWCHVMERESFESQQIADLLNANFIPVKVDREERPDVDKVFMAYVQATQGGGGWPLSLFLTPDLAPFFGGTYFPPKDAFGRPGFVTVLRRIADMWSSDKPKIKAYSQDGMRSLAELVTSEAPSAPLDATQRDQAIAACADMLAQRFDARHGGFGGAPKFPRPSELLLMLTHHRRLQDAKREQDAAKVLHMATFTLDRMAAGGMRDQLGGGFHRYSVDELWHVPHFEIMLYDQPQLVQAYLTAFQITKDPKHAATARGVMDYLIRDLRHPGGGFFAAEDADSLDPSDGKKKEGEFYVWKQEDVERLLGKEMSLPFEAHYGIKRGGNAARSSRSDPHNEFQGENILYQAQSIATTAAAMDTSEGQAEEALAKCRKELFTARATRPRPHRDEKVVPVWNGMAIGSLAAAARVLMAEDPPVEASFPVEGRNPREYLQAATAAAAFVKEKLYDAGSKRLRRAFTRTASAVAGFSDDYAHMIAGLLELYQASGEVGHLQWALELQDAMDAEFWDGESGGYFQGAAGDKSIMLRMKEDYDGAEVAASSVATANLWRLGGMLGGEAGEKLREKAQQCASAFSERLQEIPLAMPQMCCSLHLLSVGHPSQVIVAGARGAADTEALLDASFAPFSPSKLVIHMDVEDAACMAFWRRHNAEAVDMVTRAVANKGQGKALALVCQNFTCKAPTVDPEHLIQALREPRATEGTKPTIAKITMPWREA